MRFNYQPGGRFMFECGTEKATLESQISVIDADGWAPLAETLAEAGLYFAYAGDRIYLGFFKPQLSCRWIGSIKRYGLDSQGILLRILTH
ncbi:MAG: hypothetical protein JRF56_17505 [Deltaproteobacteria bacterium]|jgi:hypothetical protein|nr:hypothetical protein [Deltaproteobacteria bacterium]